MDPSFYIKLALSFVVGGLWITLASVTAERLGSKVGGVIGGLPSTAVVAYGFIAWTQGPQRAFDATTAFPLSFSANALYLIAFAALARHGLGAAIGGALATWLAAQALLLALPAPTIGLGIAVWLAVLVLAYLALERWLRVRSQRRVAVRYTLAQLAGRAAFAGGIVALAVVMTQVGGPVWGSVFASFPALYTSTLVLTGRSAGVGFARSLTTSLMISSLVNVVVFVVAFRLAVLELGLLAALAAAYLASLVSAYGTYRFIKTRLS